MRSNSPAPPPGIAEIAEHLDSLLEVHRYAADTNGIYRQSPRPVRRIGVALEANAGSAAWLAAERLDALILHCPWQINEYYADIEPDTGILAYHLAFDEHLTLGYNTRLAATLAMHDLEVCGTKEGRSLGMIGLVTTQSYNRLHQTLSDIFGGLEYSDRHLQEHIERVAIMGAMTDMLVREAAARGVQVYVTGQFRHPARQAVADTGIAVITTGHTRSEIWGIQALAGMLRERWALLSVCVQN